MKQPSRREFLFASTAAALLSASHPSSLLAQAASSSRQPLAATLSIDLATEIFSIPQDFIGLSYESAQLANPDFFSPHNHALIALFRELSPEGQLRIGGGTSAFTTFSEQAPAGPPPFEVFGPDTDKTTKSGTTTSALALQNLRGFLDATGWACLYGLNIARGTKENAANEAAAAFRILGPRLIAFQIGNEPDSFRNRYRSSTYSPEDFIHEWNDFHRAIIARVPQAKFAGPDTSNKLSFLTAFAENARQYPDVILLTTHYYAMGPAGRPDATIANLLSAQPKSSTLPWNRLPMLQASMQTAHLPLRIAEMNSCWNGGQPGVSDTFASALWCADALLHFASAGISGGNLHGGGNGIYSPIVGSPSAGFTRRPEFFGIQFAQRFAGATLLSTKLDCTDSRITAYAARTPHHSNHASQIAVINKTSAPVDLRLANPSATPHHWHREILQAPSIDSRIGVAWTPAAPVNLHHQPISISPYTAVLFTT